MPRIVIFGLPYSPNLGDGVIADCLAHALKQARPGLEVSHVDISGRQDHGEIVVKNRAAILRVLGALPRPLRHALVRARLGRMLDRFEPHWRDAAHAADLAVIGGGQIFSDADLNFPLKLARVARVLQAETRPAVIHAAGVATNWSPAGTRLFRTLVTCDLRAVGLRDAGSIAAWQQQFGTAGPAPRLTRDPGILAADCYGPSPVAPDGIGLCVTDPMILSYHADRGESGDSGDTLFAGIARALAANRRVTLFCNGAAEDRAALRRVADDPCLRDLRADDRLRIAVPAETPRQLAQQVAGFEAVVAHRLHACILGYAYARPIVGLGWDGKLQSFFASVGLEDGFITADRLGVETIASATREAMARGIDAQRHAGTLAETRAHVAMILDDLP